jgi:uncharacterized membrane protein
VFFPVAVAFGVVACVAPVVTGEVVSGAAVV